MWKLKNKQAEYKEEVERRREHIVNESPDVNELWNQMEKVTKEATEQIVGRTSGVKLKGENMVVE